ncbi:MAG: hypothetical protein RBR26_05555 [Methanosarcina mazei]|nr:hypothetical protein [Methanosarcina mazei]
MTISNQDTYTVNSEKPLIIPFQNTKFMQKNGNRFVPNFTRRMASDIYEPSYLQCDGTNHTRGDCRLGAIGRGIWGLGSYSGHPEKGHFWIASEGGFHVMLMLDGNDEIYQTRIGYMEDPTKEYILTGCSWVWLEDPKNIFNSPSDCRDETKEWQQLMERIDPKIDISGAQNGILWKTETADFLTPCFSEGETYHENWRHRLAGTLWLNRYPLEDVVHASNLFRCESDPKKDEDWIKTIYNESGSDKSSLHCALICNDTPENVMDVVYGKISKEKEIVTRSIKQSKLEAWV